MNYINRLLTIILLTLFYLSGVAQNSENKLDSREQQLTIDSISARLKTHYIFPEVADKMSELIKGNFKKKKYLDLTDPYVFANQLTEDLRSVSKDLHLRVMYSPDQIAEMNNAVSDKDREELEKRQVEQMRRENFGFKEIKMLAGNIGYLDLRGFFPPEYGGETAVAAMNFLSNADALIIDLRQNGGGNPGMIQLISSYLFDAEPVHLNNFYWRPSDEHTQTWTLPYVQGKRRPDIDTYVLTSKGTFSAAEEFSYNLKNLERATLIGETTGGGAHPGGVVNVTDKYMVWLPQGRAINPITNTNWEGTGVTPNIEVKAEEALETAQIKALEKLMKDSKDSTKVELYEWYLDGIKAKMNSVKLDESMLKTYAGTYGSREIIFDKDHLVYQRDGRFKYSLIPFDDNWFVVDGVDNFRIEFTREGQDVSLIVHYMSGNTDKSPKTQ
ncbi:MAG: S41 family peptidase [Bacteroidota bacterium]